MNTEEHAKTLVEIADNIVKPPENPVYKNIPQKLLKRNEYGLLDIDYHFKEDGRIDYRKMVPVEFLYPNPEPKKRKKIESKYGKDYKEIDVLIDKVEDEDLVILLKGTQFLARLRGYYHVDYKIEQSNLEYASITCRIHFIANYETSGLLVTFSENASATLATTKGFGQKYLVECATNRAFCRCVNNFLNLNILSKEELIGGTEELISTVEEDRANSTSKVYDLLEKALKNDNKTFTDIKNRLIQENFPNADKLNQVSDLPQEKAFYFLEKLKIARKEKKGKGEKEIVEGKKEDLF